MDSSFFSGGGSTSGGRTHIVEEDDPMSGFGSYSTGSMPGGFSSRRGPFGRSGATSHGHEVIRPLPVTLEDLYTGTTKRLKISRKLVSGETEEKVIEVQVLPGWKSGTKIRYPRLGHEAPGTVGELAAQDLVFVVEEKPHSLFKRVDNDLHMTLKIPLVDALTNPPDPSVAGVSQLPRTLRHLDGRILLIPSPRGIVKPGHTTIIPGEGMPVRKGGKGNMIITWEILFPHSLTPEKRKEVAAALKSV
jgi:DnaJ family protein B protein 4